MHEILTPSGDHLCEMDHWSTARMLGSSGVSVNQLRPLQKVLHVSETMVLAVKWADLR